MGNIFKYLTIGGFLSAGVFAVISVILFFRLQIRDVSKDLNGKQAQEQIAAIRNKKFSDANQQAAARVFQGLEQGNKQLHSTGPIATAAPQTTDGTTVLQSRNPFAGKAGFTSVKKLVYTGTKEVV